MVYTAYEQALQEPEEQCLDTVHLTRVTPTGREIVSVDEACAFQRRIDKRLTFSELRQHICLDYELGFVNAQNTLQRLWDNQLISSPEQLAGIVCAGVRALAAEGRAA